MERKLYKINEVTQAIEEGKKLVLTADLDVLKNLPKGNWIGGTIPYFMDNTGGRKSKTEIFVDDFSEEITNFKISTYNVNNINTITTDSFENGFSMLILPAASEILKSFALNSFNYSNIFKNPVIGYVAGFDLDANNQNATVINGLTSEIYTDKAVSIHFNLPNNKIAQVEILNIFSVDENMPEIKFFESSFKQKECLINGKKVNFADYVKSNNIDVKQPLIQIQSGAVINKSIMQINSDNETEFYAPIFKDISYFFSKKINNYEEKFNVGNLNIKQNDVKYSCNCILNYLYGKLEGKKLDITGATTFGEIAYQLLNQTQIYLNIVKV